MVSLDDALIVGLVVGVFMKLSWLKFFVVSAALLSGIGHAATVEYEAINTGVVSGAGHEIWRYDYWVTNDDALADPIANFAVIFPNDGDYVSIDEFETTDSSNIWDPLVGVIEPPSGLDEAGFVDFLSPSAGDDISFGATVTGFFAVFEWMGLSAPGSQPFEVYDINDPFPILDSGLTMLRGGTPPLSPVPLPGAIWLFITGLGAMGVYRKRSAKS